VFNRWKLGDFAPGAGIAAAAHADDFADQGWLDIAAPGDVHRTLIAAGRIPDPFYDRNERDCAWMEEREWWYRLRFTTPPDAAALAADQRLRLTFEGLDTFVTVWLNGEELGQHSSMFHPATFDLTGKLRADAENTLALCFDPPLARIAGRTLSTWGRNPERTAMRKAQFGYGWDWGPRLPTIGIWLPVTLRTERQAVLAGVGFGTVELTPAHDRAVVAVRVETERFAGECPLSAQICLTPPSGGASIETSLSFIGTHGEATQTAYLTIEQPELWWTHDLGTPARYHLDVRLQVADQEIDRWQRQVGIRTIVLDQSPDPAERGTRFFRFVLNGVPIFARGADWIPCDSFVGAIEPERYTALIEQSRDANMTMLRVWGGGIYEHDHFYEECDRLGLLVWQDFMFACAMYPEDDQEFVAEVDAEARYQVRRLRSHPSLALWCGCNENQWIHDMRHWDIPADSLPPYGALYYDQILPQAVEECDGRTPYWPGSPFGGNDYNDMAEGNRHNWDAWHGQFPRQFGEEPYKEITAASVSYLRYAEDMGRFVSEFGLHAAPALATLRRAMPADQLFHHSPALDWHNKDDPKNKGDLLLESTTGVPATLEAYIVCSQLAQAEGLKFAIEHYRRRKPHCSGALVWQLNDCWPALSWSVLDYHGVGKAAYHCLRRVFAPILASFKALPDRAVELWLTNDTLTPFEETIIVRHGALAGGIAWEERLTVQVGANGSWPVARWGPEQLSVDPAHYLAVRSPGGQFPDNRHLFAAFKDLALPAATPTMEINAVADNRLDVAVRAPDDAYALFANLMVPQSNARFSDNAFDLVPGEGRVVTITVSDGTLAPDDVTLQVWSR
jgi:beta-mannosidase